MSARVHLGDFFLYFCCYFFVVDVDVYFGMDDFTARSGIQNTREKKDWCIGEQTKIEQNEINYSVVVVDDFLISNQTNFLTVNFRFVINYEKGERGQRERGIERDRDVARPDCEKKSTRAQNPDRQKLVRWKSFFCSNEKNKILSI